MKPFILSLRNCIASEIYRFNAERSCVQVTSTWPLISRDNILLEDNVSK